MDSPAFGQATLSNCERELIHLAGSVQPHGVLLLLQAAAGLPVLQASENTAALLGLEAGALLGQPLSALGGDVAEAVRTRLPLLAGLGEAPLPLRCHSGQGRERRYFEGTLHQPPGGGLVLELEPIDRGVGLEGGGAGAIGLSGLDSTHGARSIAAAVQRFSAAGTLNGLCEAVVQVLRELTGYDRVMVYRFDPDGHGEIFAEAKKPELEPLLGHHYPATDIPQRARELYLRMRVRVLADVHYVPSPLVPPLRPDSGEPLDMSMCHLRSMSPLHLQYLKNMGVTGTLVAALVREGRLWGLIAAHHYQPRHLSLALRQVVELLAEVASTRIAAIENYAHVQVALMVQRLEQRLIEATSTEGDWRHALLRSPQTLLQPLEATGAALFHGDEVLTTGEVPSTRELRALCEWVHAQPVGSDEGAPFSCTSVGRLHPPLAGLAATACGVMAVRLSVQRPEYLMWFRPEQLQTVKWAGNPDKAALLAGDAAGGAGGEQGQPQDPLQLSPRRSFATWSEIVRGSARPWTLAERSMARAIGTALVDIIVQVNAVRLLIAEHQLAQIRATVHAAREPVLMTDAAGGLIFANHAFAALRGGALPTAGSAVAALFEEPARVQAVLAELAHQAWRGEWAVAGPGTPVAVRAEAVPARDGRLLGCIFVFDDLRARRQTARARQRLEASLMQASGGGLPHDEVLGAILGNASLAAMDIADAVGAPSVAPLLQEVEASAQRATQLYDRLRSFTAGG
jgi:light-regulated signal transduction histidine kinase (bacteriophytochrome)